MEFIQGRLKFIAGLPFVFVFFISCAKIRRIVYCIIFSYMRMRICVGNGHFIWVSSDTFIAKYVHSMYECLNGNERQIYIWVYFINVTRMNNAAQVDYARCNVIVTLTVYIVSELVYSISLQAICTDRFECGDDFLWFPRWSIY